jgi:hypothetical protein
LAKEARNTLKENPTIFSQKRQVNADIDEPPRKKGT